MIQRACERYKSIQKQLETDAEYQALEQALRKQSVQFHTVMQQLTKEQRSILFEHLGICAEISERITEIACFVP